MKIHDLDTCYVSPRVYQTWLAYIPQAVSELQKRFKNLQPSEIPNEQLEEFKDGSAEIFVVIRGVRLNLSVPPTEWSQK